MSQSAPVLVSRMREFGETIFAEMSALATRLNAINLGQGFPDTNGPAGMLATATDAITAGVNQYPPGPGMPELRAAVARQRERDYGLRYDPDSEIFVTVGATEGISCAVLSLVEPGDEVVVFEPFYDSYPAVVALAGARLKPVTLRPDTAGGRFSFDRDELRAAVTDRTRLILVNSPHNPTGTVFTAEELTVIAQECQRHDVVAVTDEVYEHLAYDGVPHIPLAGLPGMAERCVSISSAGKTFSVTGWKTGWVCAPRRFITAVQTVKQFTTFTANGALQLAVAYALDNESDWVAAQRIDLQAKRDRLAAGLAAAGLECFRPQGTYFIQTDVRSLGISDGTEFCRTLPHRAGVVAIPSSVFYADPEAGKPYARFAFCKRNEVIDAAARRLAEL